MCRPSCSRIIYALLLLTVSSARADAPEFLFSWGGAGGGPGEFTYALAIAVDPWNNVFVTDAGYPKDRVQKFTSEGVYVTEWGSTGSGDGQFSYPHGIAVDPAGNVYVVDYERRDVQKFTNDGVFLLKWGSFGSGPGEFSQPQDVAADADGYVYVADYGNSRVQKFTGDGDFVLAWGTPGPGPGEFNSATGIGFDGSGHVYVTEQGNRRVQKFTSDGVYLAHWGSSGSGPGQFNVPIGVAGDGVGNIYVTDRYNARVQMFTEDGAFLAEWGSFGAADGQFDHPYGVTCLGQHVYVVDFHNNRVQVFGSVSPADRLAALASSITALKLPAGVAQSLLAKVEAARQAVARGHDWTANQVLHAFVNHVEAQRGVHLGETDADALIASAEEIIALLEAEGRGQVRGLMSMDDVRLHATTPNPFDHSTTIRYGIDRPSVVDVAVYDVTGRLVRTLESAPRAAGPHTVAWDGLDDAGSWVASGTYFVRMNAGTVTRTRKAVFLGGK